MDQVLQAVQTLQTGSGQEKTQAGRFLEQFQKSTEAWQVAHDMIRSQNTDLAAKIFGAQTLRLKINYDLHQVPEQARLQLKDSVVDLLKSNVAVSRAIATQLAVALARLALQLVNWNNVLEEMVASFTGSPDSVACLLQFLKVLPEETSEAGGLSMSADDFRARTDQLLTDNSTKVLHFLVSCLGEGNKSDSTTIFECLHSWLREIDVAQVLDTPLVDLLFAACQDETDSEPFDAAVDCLCLLIRDTRETSESMVAISVLYPRVIALRPKIGANLDNDEVMRTLTRLYSEAGESWHMLIAQQPDKYRPLVECIAECTTFSGDLDVVQFTFYFWYSLKSMLVLPQYTQARNSLADVYLGLIDVMIDHLRYPDDSSSSEDLFQGDRERQDRFRSFRHEMGDVLKDCCAIVGPDQALHRAYSRVNTLLKSGSARWQDLEAPLFSMRAMAREVEGADGGDNDVLPAIMAMLVQLPEHPKIRYAATLVLGRYTEWTARHPDYLESQMQYIIAGFNSPEQDVVSAAAQSLYHFCQDCSDLLTAYVEPLYNLYGKVASTLSLDSLYELSEGMAYVIVSQPRASIYGILQHFCQHYVDALTATLTQPGDKPLYRHIADQIEVITKLVSIVGPLGHDEEAALRKEGKGNETAASIHPASQFVMDLYPRLITPLLAAHGTSPFVAERVCKFIRTCLHSCGRQLLPLLPQIAQTLVAQFQATKFGCYLWVSGSVVREFGENNNDNDPRLVVVPPETIDAVWQFSYQQSVTFYRSLNGIDASELADLIEDFFRFQGDVLLLFPIRHLSSDLLVPSVDAALTSLSLEQVDPLTATLHFLLDLLAYATDTPLTTMPQNTQVPPELRAKIVSLVALRGHDLFARLISGLIYSFPKDCVTDASSLMLLLLQLSNREHSLTWVKGVLDMLPAGSVGEDEKLNLLNRINTALTSGDFKRVRTLIRDFTTVYTRRNVTPRTGHIRSLQGLGKEFVYST